MKAAFAIGVVVFGSLLGGCVFRPRRGIVVRPAVVVRPAPAVMVAQPAPVYQ